jgi:hypothetical protein
MRAYYLIAALALPLIAGTAQAQTVTGTVTIDGSVASRCVFGISSANIPLGEISLPTTGKLDTSKVDGQNRTLTGFCNGTAATMAVEAQPLLNALAAPAGFDNRVNYTATANANSVNATDTSVTAGAGSSVLVGQFNGNVLVTLSASSSPTAGIMVAGTYAGQVLVTLNPNP